MAAEPTIVSARLALRWLVVGEWRAHPARLLLTAVAIAVGVALGFAVHLVNGSALTSFDGALRTVNGAADLQVGAASPLGFDERLYPRVALLPSIADASPVVALAASAAGAHFTLLGLDVVRAAAVTPSLVGQRGAIDRAGPFAADALFLSSAAIRATGARIGDRLEVIANGHAAALRLAGALPGVADGQAVGVIDIAAAQWRFGRLGRLDRLDLVLDGDPAAVRAQLAAMLPPGAAVTDAASAAAQGDTLSRAYRVNLDMLALVALLTGGFLVFSAQSLSVARRLRAFALIRTLGLPRSGIVATVAVEGVVVGVFGALLGLAGGYGLATAALRLFGGDLGAGYFADGSVRLAFAPGAAAGFFVLGLVAAMAGSILPARSAARVAPAVALRNTGDIVDPRAPVAWLPAVVLLLAGGIAALLPAVAGLPLFGFAAMALLLAGGVAGVPWLARRLLAPLVARTMRRVPVDLAVRHLHGAPVQAATALCGIVASTALMIAMAVMVTSFRGAVDDWLGQILSADLYVRVEGGAGFDAATQARLLRAPGVATIAFSRQIPLTIAVDRPPVTLIARPLEPGRPDASMVLLDRAPSLPPGTTPAWPS
ncbi:MAG: FtsX-like permease family protein, partial [Janthinobacterium lividum]